jgi:hypothetical protein
MCTSVSCKEESQLRNSLVIKATNRKTPAGSWSPEVSFRQQREPKSIVYAERIISGLTNLNLCPGQGQRHEIIPEGSLLVLVSACSCSWP